MPHAIWNGVVLADAPDDQIERVEGNVYFPRSAVHMEYLKDSETHSVCAWKGNCSYYDVVVNGQTNRDAAWYYPDTKPEAKHIEHRIAFWKGVQVYP
jgi:uncharacterized protein (DUF427 family)